MRQAPLLTANAFFGRPAARITAEEEARFFCALKTGNNTFKLTEHGRLRALDTTLARRLQAADARIVEALDLGISSGTTTLELADVLKRSGLDVAITGTDQSFRAMLVDLPMGCRALVEPSGHVLQYDLFGRPLNPWRRRLDYVTGMIAVRAIVHRLFGKMAASRASDPNFSRPVSLVSPRLAASPSIQLAEDDLLVRNPAFAGRFDLIRAANLLNWSYFEQEEMIRAADNILSYLRGPGAWLLVARSHNAGEHHGTLFRMSADGKLQVVERFGRGSEVEALILERGNMLR